MKSWRLAAVLMCVGALAGCGDSTSGGGGAGATGAGGAGGKGDGGSGGAPEPTTTTTTTTTGGASCDNNVDGCGDDQANSGCSGCAVKGPCKGYVDDCANNDNCLNLLNCLGSCDMSPNPDTCIADCRTTAQEAAAIYDTILKCIICDQCPTDCAASGQELCQP